MKEYDRKKLFFVSMAVILILFMVVTVYSYVSSNYVLEQASGEKIAFMTQRKEVYDIYPNEEYVLFRGREDWVEFLNRTYHSDYFSGVFNETQINEMIVSKSDYLNFINHVYFGAFWGMQSSGGHSIEIQEVVLVDNELMVFIKRTEPDGMAASVITYPCHIISIQKDDIPSHVKVDVKFIETERFLWIIILEITVLSLLLIITVIEKKRLKKSDEKDQK